MGSLGIVTGLGPVWNWLLLGLVLLGLEIVAPGVHFVWFGFSAMVVAGLVAAFAIAWGWQVLAFSLIAAVLVMVMRNYASPLKAKSDLPELNSRARQYIGRTAHLEDAISGGRGRVRIGDTMWIVAGADAPAGTKVKIVDADGIVLKVEPA